MPPRLTHDSLLADISTIHKSLEFGFSTDVITDTAKLHKKVKGLLERHCLIEVRYAANEQLPYSSTELQMPTEKMETAKECGALQVGDYHFYILYNEILIKLSLAIERKTKADFHQTILQNHERFNREITRFQNDTTLKQMYVFVECDRQEFLIYLPPGSSASIKNLIVAKRAAIASLQARGIHVCFNGSRGESCTAMRELVKMYAIKNYTDWMDL